MKITRADNADREEVAALFDLYRQFYKQAPDPEMARSFIGDRLSNGDSIILIASIDNEVAGFCQMYRTFSSIRANSALVLNDLYVRSDVRGGGLGKGLLIAAAETARSLGIESISLQTRVDNDTAISLYKSLGWILNEEYLSFQLSTI